MTFEIEWSLDYCLACDKQTSGAAYCSQSCRLADLETSPYGSEPVSPATPGSSWPSTTSTTGVGLYLTPAFDFAAHKTSKSLSPPQPPQTQASSPKSYFANQTTLSNTTPSSRALSPSASRSSLSSESSKTPQTYQLSAQARTELRGYSNSFDLIRNWRRSMNS